MRLTTSAEPIAPTATAPPVELAALLDQFEDTAGARACADPAGAYANCLALSTQCAQWLRERGVECGLLRLTGSRKPFPEGAGRWPFYDRATVQHWTVRVEDWSIDWTARQFAPSAPWPRVERVEDMPASWVRVEDWACPRCHRLVIDARHLELTPAGLDREHRAIAQATGGRGPFRDPRHDDTPPLLKLCDCGP